MCYLLFSYPLFILFFCLFSVSFTVLLIFSTFFLQSTFSHFHLFHVFYLFLSSHFLLSVPSSYFTFLSAFLPFPPFHSLSFNVPFFLLLCFSHLLFLSLLVSSQCSSLLVHLQFSLHLISFLFLPFFKSPFVSLSFPYLSLSSLHFSSLLVIAPFLTFPIF